MDTKVCNTCKIERPLTDFHRDKKGSCGVQSDCKECRKSYAKTYSESHRHKRWAHYSLIHHSEMGFIIAISVQELEQLAKNSPCCAICGKTLNWGKPKGQGPREDSPTLDRTFNDSTISLDNIQIVCHQCNSGKGRGTLQEYIEHCKQVLKFNHM